MEAVIRTKVQNLSEHLKSVVTLKINQTFQIIPQTRPGSVKTLLLVSLTEIGLKSLWNKLSDQMLVGKMDLDQVLMTESWSTQRTEGG